MSYIKLNGLTSTQVGLRLLNDLVYASASNDVEHVEVLGRNGVLLIDNQRKKPVVMSFPFTVADDKGLLNAKEELVKWLDFKGWTELELAWDDKYYYKATLSKQFDINTVFTNFGTVRLEFLVHPVKYLKTGKSKVVVNNGMRVQNDYSVSYPVTELTGNGNMSLFINGKETRFKDVQSNVVIDSQRRMVYKDNKAEWDKLVRLSKDDFPKLEKGNNTITFTGATKIEMQFNWGVNL